MMETPCAKEDIITQPPSVGTCNGDDEYILQITEDQMQQIFQSIDSIMGAENTVVETGIRNNQSIAIQELSNTTTAFLQDFEEFEKSCLPACGSEDASIDASILQDFEDFEKTMLPPIGHGNMDNVDNDILVSIDGGEGREEDMEEMVNEMADYEDETINFIEDEDDDLLTFYFDEYDFGGGGSAGGGMDPFQEPLGGTKRVHYIKCSGNNRRRTDNGIRKRKKEKRKYRGVVETEEQTAKRLEITKIKNREAAIRAHQRKKEYEEYLQGQLQKLHWKNNYLRNYIKFLECGKREDMELQPLRRTWSGLM